MSLTPDTELLGLDVIAAVSRGLGLGDGSPARQLMFTDAAIAAALEAEDLRVGAYPLGFLARYIRTAGLDKALELPEPLIRPEQAELARDWMRAAVVAPDSAERDDVFAQWLDMVASLLVLRRNARLAAGVAGGVAGESR